MLAAGSLALTQAEHAGAAQASAAPKAYVGLFKDNAVAVLDTATRQVLTTIPVPAGPHGVVITPDGRKVYVSSDGASTVSVVDTSTDRVIASVEVGPTPHGLAISPDGRRVLVSGFGSNEAEILDTATDRLVGRVSVPQPHNSAISPDGRRAYVGSQLQGSTALVLIDLDSQTQLASLPLDQTPRALAFSPDGSKLYFTLAGSDEVQVLDPPSNQVVAQIPVGASPHQPLFTPDGATGLVVSQGPGELALLDAANRVAATVQVGALPHWIATSGDGRLAFVTNEGSGDVSVVNLPAREVVATIPVGQAPRKIAVQPGALGSSPAPAQASASAGGRQVLQLRGSTVSDHGTHDASGQTRLELEADDYYFEPTYLQGAPGQTLTLEIENSSGTLHNFSIPELGLDRDLPPHSTVELPVTFPASGSLSFSCKFHTALGMAGELRTGDARP
jgi:YVTN family beta-propeller protein